MLLHGSLRHQNSSQLHYSPTLLVLYTGSTWDVTITQTNLRLSAQTLKCPLCLLLLCLDPSKTPVSFEPTLLHKF